MLPVVAGQGLRNFVDLWLKCILAIHLLFFHFFDDFLALLVSLVKSFNSISFIFTISFWITFTNNFWSQVNLRLKWVFLTSFSLLFSSLFRLFLQEGFLSCMKVFQVSIEHRWIFTYPSTFLRYIWLMCITQSIIIKFIHRIEELILQTVGCISVKPLIRWSLLLLLHVHRCIIIATICWIHHVFHFDYFLWFFIYFWLKGKVTLFLFIFDS